MSYSTRCLRCGAIDPKKFWHEDTGGCSECRLPEANDHAPRHRYDCGRCKFSWNCGLACGCVLKRGEYDAPPERVKMERLRAFLDEGDRFIKDKVKLDDYIRMIWDDE